VTLDDTRAVVAQRAQSAGQPAQQAAPSIIQQIEVLRPQMARVLPAHIDADQMARAVITQLRKTPRLMSCTADSVLGAVMTCAQLGMLPGPGGEVWLIPRKGKAEFQLGYQGMVTLFWRHPAAAGLTTATVYEHDEFEHEEGLEPKLRHMPAKDRDPGRPVAYYAIARTVGGGVVWKVLYPWQIEKHRARSSSPNSPAWVDDYSSMAEKTCIRVLFKVLPKNAETARALANDGTVRTDLNPNAIDTPDWIPGEVVEHGAIEGGAE
jgi:recombination protein RecT